jgi:small subunit ribosomal protein S20
MIISEVRTSRKRFLSAVTNKDSEKAAALLKQTQKLIDTAAGKGVVGKNTAARLKSRLHQRFNDLGSA